MSVPERIKKGTASGSLVRRMFDEGLAFKKKYGAENVFDLSLGNPITEPPMEFKQELLKLAESKSPGLHRYMENAGYVDTRAAIANNINKEAGTKFTENEIVMTCGAAAALNVVLRTILTPGDEVILFTPYFPEYFHYITHHDGIVKTSPTDEQFIPRIDLFEKTVGLKTRAVIINSPNNPTGVVYGEKVLHDITDVLKRKQKQYGTQILLISDEAYSRILFDGLKYQPIWPHYSESIVVTSHSKDLALPGERIGYIAIHPGCTDKDGLLNGFIYSNRTLGFVNAPALMQRIVARLQGISVPASNYQNTRDYLYNSLTEMGYSIVKPQGAFYMFPESLQPDDFAFVSELQQERVLTVPGQGFGTPGFFRIGYCVDNRTLEGALIGFRKVAEIYKI
ncbi:MAG: pyridoxal phosphate-dependent aminotransferase [Dehalococcoidales bacterium]|nr:pyridoxal phosphate-dependent aminotransferase [Dehalococcoidales bacterium]